MYGIHKRYSQELSDAHDPKSRRVVIEYFKKHGIQLVNNSLYQVDLVSPDGAVRIEIEHRPPWVDAEFPYSDINVPERKAKFLNDGVTSYAILSRDFSRMGIIAGKDVKEYIVDENLHLNKNKYVHDGEYFYKIQTEKFKLINLNEKE